MTKPFHLMQQAAERLADRMLQAAEATPERQFGGPIHAAAKESIGSDLESRSIVMGTDPHTRMIRPVDIRHVDSAPLMDSSGRIIGVGFPIRQGENWFDWSRAESRYADRYYSDREPVVTKNPDGTSQLDFPGTSQAPWDSGNGQPPTYVAAHGRPGHVAVRTRPEDGETSEILVNGRDFGRILAANDHYRLAIAENSPNTASLICYGDSTAQETSAELWAAGIDTDFYAFKTQVTTSHWNDKTNSNIALSWVSAKADDSATEKILTDPIAHHAPPNRKSDDSI